MSFWGPLKSIEAPPADAVHKLHRTLGWPHLVALGVGAIVGTGILTLTGVGAALAGPGVILSFLIAGAVCAAAALAYAELAAMIPQSGSAYTYSYVAVGETIAWIVGWSLILEYSVVCSTVAVGWSGYFTGFMDGIGWTIPKALAGGPDAGGLVNLPAVGIIAVVAGLLLVGTRESATLNAALVALKIAALAMFVAVTLPHFDAANFHPFMPFGFFQSLGPDGAKHGVMAAASIIFFAFYGFDAVSTAAEEAKNPGRDMTIGIVGSMLACVVIYMGVAACAIGAVPVASFANSAEPLALVLRTVGSATTAKIFGAVAVVALPTVILAFLFGQTRIFFVMARDRLLPERLGRVHPRSGVPVAVTIGTAIIVAIIAAFLPLAEIAALANAGTLCAFVAVGASMLILRRREPNRERAFRTPLAPLVGAVAILGCLYLFWNLPFGTQVRFFAWNGLGLIVYFAYARRRSVAVA
ncbi:amino acid permease [Sphingomonas oligoaromativorans]|uniref:amino acid permease n=1 Tax=Sphingomonas oligoaromativorans TaxID=575322 RepID=UPI001420775E|nr:amino acid permease [Sphingomonas oligoaromativorans]NIJ33981.1 APA family basic amino acid/polyamine antiporter [Sphingomonas oligoaromativorans]